MNPSLLTTIHWVVGVIVLLIFVFVYYFFISQGIDLMRRGNVGILLKNFAETNNWVYTPTVSSLNFPDPLFHQNLQEFIRISSVVQGSMLALPFSLFLLEKERGAAVSYSVIEVDLKKDVPHIIFPKKRTELLEHFTFVKGEEEVLVPTESNGASRNQLFTTKGYELEATQLFDPEPLRSFINQHHKLSFELVNSRLYVYSDYGLTSKKLNELMLCAQQLVQSLTEKLPEMQTDIKEVQEYYKR